MGRRITFTRRAGRVTPKGNIYRPQGSTGSIRYTLVKDIAFLVRIAMSMIETRHAWHPRSQAIWIIARASTAIVAAGAV